MDPANGWGSFSSSLPLLLPNLSLNSYSITGFGWSWVQHRNEMVINKTKAHGFSAPLSFLYVASCLDPSHTYIYYPHGPSRLFIGPVSVSVTPVELGV